MILKNKNIDLAEEGMMRKVCFVTLNWVRGLKSVEMLRQAQHEIVAHRILFFGKLDRIALL